jgi:hypothetical protein
MSFTPSLSFNGLVIEGTYNQSLAFLCSSQMGCTLFYSYLDNTSIRKSQIFPLKEFANDNEIQMSIDLTSNGKTLTITSSNGQNKTIELDFPILVSDRKLKLLAQVASNSTLTISKLEILTPPNSKLMVSTTSEPAILKMPWGDKTGNDFNFDFNKVTPEQTQDIAKRIWVWDSECLKGFKAGLSNVAPLWDWGRYSCVNQPLGLKAGIKIAANENIPRWAKDNRIGISVHLKQELYNVEVVGIGKPTNSAIPIIVKGQSGTQKEISIAKNALVRANIPKINNVDYSFAEVGRNILPGMFKPGMIIGLGSGQYAKQFFEENSAKRGFTENNGVYLYVFNNCEQMRLACP